MKNIRQLYRSIAPKKVRIKIRNLINDVSKAKKSSKASLKSRIKRLYNYVYPNPDVFGVKAFEDREKFREEYRIVANSLALHLEFKSVMDVGCAQGFIIDPLYRKGYQVQGIEISEDVIEFLPSSLEGKVSIGDFSDAKGSYDLVCCVEVAEHLEPARSEELVEKLCEMADSWIYFTAAPPGQSGHGHINCRPHQHWIRWFEERDWYVDDGLTRKIREDMDDMERARWLLGNSFIFSSS